MPAPKADPESVRRLHARGLNDRQVAESLGWDRKTVWQWRRRLGLPSNHDPAEAGRKVVRRAIEARLARLEGDALALAGSYGLPEDLAPAQVAVVLALLDGAATAESLADRCGRARAGSYRRGFDRFRCNSSSRGTNNYLTDLCDRRLVARVPGLRGKGGGSGRGAGLYLLTTLALDLLARAGQGDSR